MRLTLVIGVLACAATTLAQSQNQSQTPDLITLLNSNQNLTQFSALLQSYGNIYGNLSNVSSQQALTIYAPSNDAFQKIPYQVLGPAFETNNSDIIRAVLQYHIVPGLHPSTSFNGSFSFIPTSLNNQTYSNVTGGQVIGGVQQAGEVWVVVSGMGSRSTVTTLDLKFTGGIVHIIDTLFVPPQSFTISADQFNLSSADGAVLAAGLDTLVDTTKDLTFFAPNSAALEAIESDLSTMSTEDLAKLLSYHVVNGTHPVGYSTRLLNGTVLKSLEGTDLKFTFKDNSIFVNSARVVQQDLLLSNGVLHVLDSVLDYNSTGTNYNATLGTQIPVLPGTQTGDNTLPFTTFLSNSTSVLFSLASPTADATSLGAGGLGAATTTLGGSASSAGGQAAETSSKKKSAGERVEMGSSGLGSVLAAFVCGLIGLL